jgi:predicted MPP superfamily phosphohydrolase
MAHKTKPRRSFWKMAFAIAMAILLIYGFVIEPRWVQVTVLQKQVGLKGASFKIAQLSDLHLSGKGAAEEATLIHLKALQPNLILLAGDVIDDRHALPALDDFLKDLPDAIKVAILGNWEHWSGADLQHLSAIYKRHQVRLLINECLPLLVNGVHLSLAGLDDYTAGQPDLAGTLQQCKQGTPIIMAQHSPGMFDEAPSPELGQIAYSLAGHTHGGQVAMGQHALFTPRGSGRYVAGSYQTAWGDLYVSRGIGTSMIPLRIGARPEIVLLELR